MNYWLWPFLYLNLLFRALIEPIKIFNWSNTNELYINLNASISNQKFLTGDEKGRIWIYKVIISFLQKLQKLWVILAWLWWSWNARCNGSDSFSDSQSWKWSFWVETNHFEWRHHVVWWSIHCCWYQQQSGFDLQADKLKSYFLVSVWSYGSSSITVPSFISATTVPSCPKKYL